MTNENWQSRGYFSEELCPSELRGSPFGEVRVSPLDNLLELFPDTPENKKKWVDIRKMTKEMRDNFDDHGKQFYDLNGAKWAKTQVLKNSTKGKENLMNTILSTAYKKNGIIGAAIIIFLAATAWVLLFTFLGLWAGGVI